MARPNSMPPKIPKATARVRWTNEAGTVHMYLFHYGVARFGWSGVPDERCLFPRGVAVWLLGALKASSGPGTLVVEIPKEEG